MNRLRDFLKHFLGPEIDKEDEILMKEEAALGYMILASRKAFLTAQQEEKLVNAVVETMDYYTEQDAIEAYREASDQEREQQTAGKEFQWKSEREIEKEAKGA